MLELDHVFIFTQPEAPEAEAVIALGLTEGTQNIHLSQGTANRRIFFRNAMLEFLWVRDAAETQTAQIAPMEFLARANSDHTGYSPFGIGLRYAPDGSDPPKSLPFQTWAFRPPYLPSHLQFEVAYTQPHEPLIFIIPFSGTRPDTLPSEKRPPLEHANQMREITGVDLTIPNIEWRSPALRVLQEAGIATFNQGQEHLLEVRFDRAKQGKTANFQPKLPLLFKY